MRKTLIALATSAGVALGSFGMTAAPAVAAMTAPQLATQAPDNGVSEVKHRWHHRKRLVCHTHWKWVKVWRWGHWKWIKVPRQHCHWVWRGHRGW